MPLILEQPRLLHPTLAKLPVSCGSALMTVTGILKAPPDQPQLPLVIANVLNCLKALQARVPYASLALTNLTLELAVAGKGLGNAIDLIQPGGMIGGSVAVSDRA